MWNRDSNRHERDDLRRAVVEWPALAEMVKTLGVVLLERLFGGEWVYLAEWGKKTVFVSMIISITRARIQIHSPV